MRALLSSVLALGLFSCATSHGPQTYRGTWDWHFETSAFVTDHGDGPYWLISEGNVHAQLVAPMQQSGQGPWGREAIVVEGQLSEPGHYGHMGAYTRQLRVTRVIETHLIAASHQPQGN